MNPELSEARVRRVAKKYQAGAGSRRGALPGGARRAPKPIKLEWTMYAGGTTAQEGKHSYDTKGWFGEFHIWPPQVPAFGERRRTRGYSLMWANSTGLPVTHTHMGLWHDVGVFK